MGKFKDLTGREFGKLVVVKQTAEKRRGNILWECKCGCGSIVKVTSSGLLNGSTKSCGCLQLEKAKKQMEAFVAADIVEGTSLTQIALKAPRKDNRCGVRGVHWREDAQMWRARINFKGECLHLGYFSKLEDAAKARSEAEEKFFKPIIERHKDRLIP